MLGGGFSYNLAVGKAQPSLLGQYKGEETAMQFGVAIPIAGDSWGLARREDGPGVSHAWFFDTRMLNPDPFVGMKT